MVHEHPRHAVFLYLELSLHGVCQRTPFSGALRHLTRAKIDGTTLPHTFPEKYTSHEETRLKGTRDVNRKRHPIIRRSMWK